MYDDILLPTDGSTGTDETVRHAMHAAERDGATVHALSVVDSRIHRAAPDDSKEAVRDRLRDEAESAVTAVAAAAEERGVEVTTNVREGTPHRTIVEYAEETGVDLVTIGTHGRTGRDRLARLGSVTERVVENVSVPALVVHIDGEE